MEAQVDSLWQLLPGDSAREGLTSSSLHLYLERLRERSRELRCAIYTSLDEVCAGGRTVDRELLLKLQALLGTDSTARDPKEEALLVTMEEHSKLAGEVEALEASLNSMRAQVERQQRLQEIRQRITAGKFNEAAHALLYLQSALASSSSGDDEDLLATRKSLKQAMLAWWKRSVVLDEEEGGGSVQLPDDGHIQNVAASWEAMELLGLGDRCLKHLADGLMAIAIRPIVLQRETTVVVQPSCLHISLPKTPPTPSGTEDTAEMVAKICELLIKVIEFVGQRISGGDLTMCASLGKNLWPRICKGIIAKRLRPLEAEDSDGMEAFRQASSAACALEQQAVKLSLCDPSSCLLTEYAKTAEASQLRREISVILGKARKLVTSPPTGDDLCQVGGGLSEPFGTAVEGEEGCLLAEGSYQVSRAATEIPPLIDALLRRAAEAADLATTAAFCGAVEDIATLMATVPPVLHSKQLQAAQLAALYFNDCHYLSVHLAKLTLRYGPSKSEPTGKTPSFVSAAVQLRDAGQAALTSVLADQERQLMELLDGAHRFSLRRKQTAGLTCRKVVSAVLHSLKRLAAVLRPVLNAAAFINSASALLQAVCSRVVDDLLAVRDFDAEESAELPIILMPIVEDSLDALAPSPHHGTEAEAEQRAMCVALKSSAPAFQKLLLMIKLLQARLSDIGRMWEAGECQEAGLSAGEVAHLVQALFEDTSLRDEQLSKILEG